MKDLSMHILDIIQNSVRAKASIIELCIIEDKEQNLYTIIIKDNGIGMDKETLKKVTDPFFTTRTTRKVGLGLSLLKQNVERTGGYMTLSSKRGVGTNLRAVFEYDNWDRPSTGDIAGTIILLVGANPKISFTYKHRTSKGLYVFSTEEVIKILAGVPINEPEILRYLKEMINENLKNINIG